MGHASRPAIAAGVALVIAALIGVVPSTTTGSADIQQRLVQLTTAGELYIHRPN